MVEVHGWHCVSMHDPEGRRGVWFRDTSDGIEVRGGREGDDARCVVTGDAASALRDVLAYGSWMQEYYGPNTSVEPK